MRCAQTASSVGAGNTIASHTSDASSAHYRITPYAYRPRLPRKLVSTHYVDIGQGLLDCLHEIADPERAPS